MMVIVGNIPLCLRKLKIKDQFCPKQPKYNSNLFEKMQHEQTFAV